MFGFVALLVFITQKQIYQTTLELGKHYSGDEDWNNESDSVAKMRAAEEALQGKETQKPSFELSGKLAAETNRVRGVTLLFTEPPDARKPSVRWRMYVFKAGEVLNGEKQIVENLWAPVEESSNLDDSVSPATPCFPLLPRTQHQVEKEEPDGTLSKKVRPYVMDLGSTNKTYVNDNAVEPQRYYELFEKDTIRFAENMYYCTRTRPRDGQELASQMNLLSERVEHFDSWVLRTRFYIVFVQHFLELQYRPTRLLAEVAAKETA
ncbi:FHA domain-containing protein DDL [Morella rubra]|uniref:FHA domain-containing protein DDL n=1 Tax=Morella rubra TaxID=262757 RepID=A0A6A1UIR0_9ROSI|nr:FHA domain-containing protein DDL [Morella rubra]